ncbi:murein hydrolase activator EnvC family protein [Aureispira anguillae]|uniref:Peptidoglycan DD-metalloendopeptidase family protein n=1 Tax=Aureispira anguillae TaxID=2864201 RepID=A0A916DX58_9BACT|nr:peptidoglycan DD-metalloendopeptidase family protein [Aureispira anguillae]BDS14726.1 peptidoglycan DD-metalloendopeptidase family protein [Aureispira anguillae]
MKHYTFTFLLILIGCTTCLAQSRSDLEKKRRSINHEINKTNLLIRKTTNNKKATFQKLNLLKQQIDSREESIEVAMHHVDQIDTMIDRKMTVVEVLESDLVVLRSNYKKLIRQLYRYKISRNVISFLLSSNSFNQAYQRWIYIQHLEGYRNMQAKFIQQTQKDLTQRINQLEQQKSEQDLLLQQEIEQKQLLADEKKNKAQLIEQLKKKEARLRSDLKRKKRYKIQLNKKIERAILEQIASAKEAARKYQQQQTKKPRRQQQPAPSILLEDEASRQFAQQRGQLMSPIYHGVIVGYYGRRNHPLFQDVIVNNNGIDIKGQYNSVVRNVYKGEVVSIFTIPGFNNAVMVKHGNYYTTYSNIAKVYVKKGQRLKTGGQIGTIGRDTNAGGHVLHFEVWHNKSKENPANWIKR